MSKTLFESGTPVGVEEKPEQPPDKFNLYAVQVLGFLPDWIWYQLDCSDEVAPKGFGRVEGAVKKGREWDESTKKVFFFEFSKLDEWFKSYAKGLGKCPICWNSKKRMMGFSASTGARYEPCKCDGL